MGFTQNYYNLINNSLYGASGEYNTGNKYGAWTTTPDALCVKRSTGTLVAVVAASRYDRLCEIPFTVINEFADTNNGATYIIPSYNQDDEALTDYTVTTSFTTHFESLSFERHVDFDNHKAYVVQKYRSKSAYTRTVYGIEVVIWKTYGNNRSDVFDDLATILLYRKKFDTPVSVPAGELLELKFEWDIPTITP